MNQHYHLCPRTPKTMLTINPARVKRALMIATMVCHNGRFDVDDVAACSDVAACLDPAAFSDPAKGFEGDGCGSTWTGL